MTSLGVSTMRLAYNPDGSEVRLNAEKNGLRVIGYRVVVAKDGKVVYLSQMVTSDIKAGMMFTKKMHNGAREMDV